MLPAAALRIVPGPTFRFLRKRRPPSRLLRRLRRQTPIYGSKFNTTTARQPEPPAGRNGPGCEWGVSTRMPRRMSDKQREAILRRLARGEDRETIAASVGVTPGQVSAIAAHVKMGTYTLPAAPADEPGEALETAEERERTANLLRQLRDLGETARSEGHAAPVLLGTDAESGEAVFWNPNPQSGSANSHVLVLGESGFGKTCTIACLLAELARQQILSIVFDYGQGFALDSLPREFVQETAPAELHASRDGVDINPLQIFPTDLHGPVNVAQRVADTFARVYLRIGVQQHAVLRQAVLEVMADEGIFPEVPDSWERDLPAFANVQRKLTSYANEPGNPQGRFAVRQPRGIPAGGSAPRHWFPPCSSSARGASNRKPEPPSPWIMSNIRRGPVIRLGGEWDTQRLRRKPCLSCFPPCGVPRPITQILLAFRRPRAQNALAVARPAGIASEPQKGARKWQELQPSPMCQARGSC